MLRMTEQKQTGGCVTCADVTVAEGKCALCIDTHNDIAAACLSLCAAVCRFHTVPRRTEVDTREQCEPWQQQQV